VNIDYAEANVSGVHLVLSPKELASMTRDRAEKMPPSRRQRRHEFTALGTGLIARPGKTTERYSRPARRFTRSNAARSAPVATLFSTKNRTS
jgi:hypothetical protein